MTPFPNTPCGHHGWKPSERRWGEDYLSSGPVMNFLSAATTLSGGEGPFLFVSRMLQRIKYMFEFGGSLSRTKSLRDCEHANNATRGADKVSSPCRSMKKPFLLLSCFHFVYSISHEKEGRRGKSVWVGRAITEVKSRSVGMEGMNKGRQIARLAVFLPRVTGEMWAI